VDIHICTPWPFFRLTFEFFLVAPFNFPLETLTCYSDMEKKTVATQKILERDTNAGLVL